MCPTGWNECWENPSLNAYASFCLVLLCVTSDVFIIKKSIVCQHFWIHQNRHIFFTVNVLMQLET